MMMYCPGSGGQVRVPRSVSQDRRGKERSRSIGKIVFIGLPVVNYTSNFIFDENCSAI